MTRGKGNTDSEIVAAYLKIKLAEKYKSEEKYEPVIWILPNAGQPSFRYSVSNTDGFTLRNHLHTVVVDDLTQLLGNSYFKDILAATTDVNRPGGRQCLGNIELTGRNMVLLCKAIKEKDPKGFASAKEILAKMPT